MKLKLTENDSKRVEKLTVKFVNTGILDSISAAAFAMDMEDFLIKTRIEERERAAKIVEYELKNSWPVFTKIPAEIRSEN